MVNIVIFGTGRCSERVEKILRINKVNIVAYCDNNGKKQGTKRNGIDILSPSNIDKFTYDYIIVSTIHFKEVFQQLINYRIPIEKIIGYYEDNSARYTELEEFIDIFKWNSCILRDLLEAEMDHMKKKNMIFINNIQYEVAEKIEQGVYVFPQFYSFEETIEKICKNNCSLCRFGDGEFEIMSNKERSQFQKVDFLLAERLKEVINCEDENILIAIAKNYGSLDEYTENAADAIRAYMNKETREKHRGYLKKNKIYHNAYISRPYIMYKNKDKAGENFHQLKRIWKNKDIVIIEGQYTRMGVRNDLFSNAKSIKRILAPAVDAFSVYDKIFEEAKRIEKDKLILIALGPTATVLAYDLAQLGYHALDIGHIDIEYEWYLAGVNDKVNIDYKYVNDVFGGDVVQDIADDWYNNQIIAVIHDKSD